MAVELQGETHPYYVLDVFTDTPLEGNQLGLFPEAEAISAEQMQRIARELNVAETIFLLPPEQGGTARVRIFTPGTELAFAGHPVLGAAVFLGRARGLDEVSLETQRGLTPVELDGGSGWMTQPPFRTFRTTGSTSCSRRWASRSRCCRSRPTRTARGTRSSGSPTWPA